ncbi:predicted protein [Naegleria gruberi]|uniref:Predicted protein n=1 Tax=Naegleria gruberi TaxID=5762 RepID=D2W3M7_NAEGR|nr:uncharacterized protein NAEGRDRAFT_75997 [Naegleria gruberi]EFC36335.1 predicted protein [Naegleria gruberi]|eukprot:XP_002669079.1 predicted protein [Naegleria gruberi strain NEG-M]
MLKNSFNSTSMMRKKISSKLENREEFGAKEIITRNDKVEYTIMNIHDRRADEDNLKKNQRQLNEILTRTLYEAQRNLSDLSSLTKKKLGPKALLYQQQSLVDDTDPLSALGDVGNFDSVSEEDGIKTDKLDELGSTTMSSSIMKKASNNKLNAMTENLMLNQLIDLVDQKKREKQQEGIFDNSLREIFLRTRGLIENLWDEMNIEDSERRDFSRRFFYPETLINYVSIFREITRLTGVRSIQHDVLTSLEQREVYIKRLKEIAMQFNGYRAGASSLMGRLQDPMVKNEIPTIVSNLRNVTIELVESILLWRSQLTKKTVFLYNGENYMLKMRNDVDFLKLTELAPLFEIVGITIDSNPLLLPDDVRGNNNISFDEYVNEILNEGDENINKSQTALTLVEHYQSKRDHDKKQANRFNEDQNLQNIPRVLKINLPFAYMERLRRSDKFIFQEELYIKLLEDRAMRDQAATKIQSQWRSFLARRYMKRLKMETKKAAAYTNSNNFLNQQKKQTLRNEAVIRNLPKKIEALTTKDLIEELEKNRKADVFLDSLNISGRYSTSIFDFE